MRTMRCIDGAREGDVVRISERRILGDAIYLIKPRKPLTASLFDCGSVPTMESMDDLTETYYIHEGFNFGSRFRFLSILTEIDDDYLNFKMQTSQRG